MENLSFETGRLTVSDWVSVGGEANIQSGPFSPAEERDVDCRDEMKQSEHYIQYSTRSVRVFPQSNPIIKTMFQSRDLNASSWCQKPVPPCGHWPRQVSPVPLDALDAFLGRDGLRTIRQAPCATTALVEFDMMLTVPLRSI